MMRLRAKLLTYTAAVALSASVAFAAVDGNAIADAYLAAGYDFVQVKVGPTQTKVEAIKGDSKIEVVIDNATGSSIKTEQEPADADEIGLSGAWAPTPGAESITSIRT